MLSNDWFSAQLRSLANSRSVNWKHQIKMDKWKQDWTWKAEFQLNVHKSKAFGVAMIDVVSAHK